MIPGAVIAYAPRVQHRCPPAHGTPQHPAPDTRPRVAVARRAATPRPRSQRPSTGTGRPQGHIPPHPHSRHPPTGVGGPQGHIPPLLALDTRHRVSAARRAASPHPRPRHPSTATDVQQGRIPPHSRSRHPSTGAGGPQGRIPTPSPPAPVHGYRCPAGPHPRTTLCRTTRLTSASLHPSLFYINLVSYPTGADRGCASPSRFSRRITGTCGVGQPRGPARTSGYDDRESEMVRDHDCAEPLACGPTLSVTACLWRSGE
jgi:hypothetical protein